MKKFTNLFSNSTKAIPSMLRYINHGMRQIDEKFFQNDGTIWDESLDMPAKYAEDFNLDTEKRRYIDYLESAIMFVMPRQSTNRALNKRIKFPTLSSIPALSNRQKSLYDHIQKDSLEQDTYEMEIAVLRPNSQEPLVTRRMLADGDPVHLSMR